MGPLLGLWWSLVVLGSFLVVAAACTGLTRAEAAVGGSALVAAVAAARAGGPAAGPGPGRHRPKADLGPRRDPRHHGGHRGRARPLDHGQQLVRPGRDGGQRGGALAGPPSLAAPSLRPARGASWGWERGSPPAPRCSIRWSTSSPWRSCRRWRSAARQDFADVNSRVMDDPRVTVVIDDGRNYLASAPQAFDVIVGDLLVPWRPARGAPLHAGALRVGSPRPDRRGRLLPVAAPLPALARAARHHRPDLPRRVPRRQPLARQLHPGRADPGPRRPSRLPPIGSPKRSTRASRPWRRRPTPNPFLEHPAGMWLFLVGPLKAGDALVRGSASKPRW